MKRVYNYGHEPGVQEIIKKMNKKNNARKLQKKS